MRRTTFLLAADLTLIACATLIAFLLRDGIDGLPSGWEPRVYYIGWTVGVACLVFCAAGIHRTLYRFSSVNDYLWLSSLTVVSVVGAMGTCFFINRLEAISRTLPVLQVIFAVAALVIARVGYRLFHARLAASRNVHHEDLLRVEDILVVGVNPVADLFVRSVDILGRGQIRVHGILTSTGRCLKGRRIGTQRVLGELADLSEILSQLKVHGVDIARLVVTDAEEDLSDADRARLSQMSAVSGLSIDYFADRLGFAEPRKPALAASPLVRATQGRRAVGVERYRFGKRLFDLTLATALLVLLWPLMVLVAVVVWADVGRPLLFWQQRPGQGGRPIRVFKFRTMRGAYDKHGFGLADAQRLSAVGAMLRARRLDELPQLFNILVGDMSFVGPRPLLPIDQPSDRRDRLGAKPGLTGWAQVMGGRTITAADKAALDRWYVDNMSFALDIEVMLRTVPMILFGERVNAEAIRVACAAIGRVPDYQDDHIISDGELGSSASVEQLRA